MAKIYTKVGDKGHTSLVGGQKISKDDPRIDAYGTVDELNSTLGLARSELYREIQKVAAAPTSNFDSLNNLLADLETLQHWLFDLGSLLASHEADRIKFKLPPITEKHIEWLEGRIDGATAVLKPLKNFILPGGTELAGRLHVARTITRRAERAMVGMTEDLPENAIPFINRISDYLFTMARLANRLLDVEDIVWEQRHDF